MIYFPPEYKNLAQKIRENYIEHHHGEVDLVSETDQNDIEYARKEKYDEAIFIENIDSVVIMTSNRVTRIDVKFRMYVILEDKTITGIKGISKPMNGGYERNLVATVFCYKTIIWKEEQYQMARRYHESKGLSEFTAKTIVSDEEQWKKFLHTAGHM